MSVLIVDKNLFEVAASKGALIENLLDLGEVVSVVVFSRSTIDWSSEYLKKVQVFCLDSGTYLHKLMSMYKVFKSEDWTVIYSSRFVPNFLTYLVIFFTRNSTVYFHVNGLGRYFSRGQGIGGIFVKNGIRFFYRFAERRVVLIFQNYSDPLDIGAKRYMVVEGSGALESRLTLDDREDEKERRFDFCFISRLSALKGIYLLKDLASMLPDRSFVVVGDTRGIAVQDFPANVSFAGFQSDVGKFLRISRYFLFPSGYREGVPRSVLEALYLGLPVVVPNTAGCFGLASYGNGEIYDNGSLLSLKSAVDRLLTRDYDEMCFNSRLLYNMRYSAKMNNEKLLRLTYLKGD